MNYRVIISPEAEHDIDDMADWIAAYSQEQTVRWYVALRKAVNSLRKFPMRCSLAYESTDEKEVRLLFFAQHRLVFSIEGSNVYVVHVRHQRQRLLTPREL